MNTQGIVTATRWTTAALLLAAIVAVYHLWLHVNPTTVALTMLTLVLFLASRWGLRYGVATSLAATVCYNFYFLPPVGTFTINDPQNWLGLFVFLITSVIGSRLAERVREEAEDARLRQQEVEVLYRLSRELLQTENVVGLLNAVAPAAVRATAGSAALLYLLEGDRRYQAGDPDLIQRDDIGLRQLAQTLPAADVVGSESRIPLRVGVRPRGILLLNGRRLSVETLQAMGGLVSIAIDRARALEEVTRGEAAKESERLRSLMIDSITHELRTPLTSIKAAASTLLTSPALTAADQRDLLSVIDEESDRLNRLVSEAVEMAQLDAQEVHMSFVATPVPELIEHALASASGLAQHPVEQRVPSVPPVMADAAFLEKVLVNLLENAAKYSSAQSPIFISAEYRAASRGGAGHVAISVADRGVGIDASEQSLIFERFYRASSQSQRTSGTGMGLPISRAILEAHHGTLTVTSQPGVGSVFTFTLPVAREPVRT